MTPALRQILNHWTTREVTQTYTVVKLLGQKLSELSALQSQTANQSGFYQFTVSTTLYR